MVRTDSLVDIPSGDIKIFPLETDPFLLLHDGRVTPTCLDHGGIIQRMGILTSSRPISDIGHGRKGKQIIGIRNADRNDLDLIRGKYREWKKNYENYPRYLHIHGPDGEGRNVPLKTRFHSTRNIYHLSRALQGYTGPGVFLTLTVERIYSLSDAWENILKWWNSFITKLSQRLKISRSDLRYIWVLEAQHDGYPHIHALFIGRSYLYRAGSKEEYENDHWGSGNLKHIWGHGSIFVNSTWKKGRVRSPIRYMMKYIRKSVGRDENGKTELTHSLLWFFGRRQWGTSRKLLGWLGYEKPEPTGEWRPVSIDRYEKIRGQSTPLVFIEEPTVLEPPPRIDFSSPYRNREKWVVYLQWIRKKKRLYPDY